MYLIGWSIIPRWILYILPLVFLKAHPRCDRGYKIFVKWLITIIEPILPIIAAAYGIYDTEFNEDNAEKQAPGFLQGMTFLLILEVQNLFHAVVKMKRKVAVDIERGEKDEEVRKVIISLAEKEDEAEKT